MAGRRTADTKAGVSAFKEVCMKRMCLLMVLLVVAALAAGPGLAMVNPTDVYPGLDTIEWCEFNSNSGGNTIRGYLAGYGVKLTPDHYPAIPVGCLSRVFRLNSDSAQILLVDDDGASGAPGSNICKRDTLVPSYSGQFHLDRLPVPPCTVWSGSFYLFILGNYHGVSNALNWLNDGSLSAPTGTHWRRDSLGAYSQAGLGGDLQLCALVEYHDATAESLSGLPADDTVYVESTYSLAAHVSELAGFAESRVPVILDIGGLQADTAFAQMAAGDTGSARFDDWQANVPPGTYDCVCYSALRSDTRHGNDTVRFELAVALSPSAVTEEKLGPDASPLFTIRPNPVSRRTSGATVVIGGQSQARLSVRDVTGRQEQLLSVPSGVGRTVQLDLHSLSPGVYLITCATPNRTETQLLVVH
jgi:hypothetical protein